MSNGMRKRNWELWISVIVPLAYALSYAAAFPPIDAFEAGFFFAIPHILWVFRKPSWRAYLVGAYLGSWGAWIFLLSWLRHVPEAAGMAGATWIGWGLVILLAGLVGLFNTGWLAGLRWLIPRLEYRTTSERILGMVALGAFWVVLEWIRTWFLFGFPWLPLSASQWRNPVILQVAAYTGAYGISFLLVILNLGIGFYLWKIVTTRKGTKWYRRVCPEFYFSMGSLMLAIVLYVQSMPSNEHVIPAFRAGVVQPDIPQTFKWEDGQARENLQILEQQTRFINALEPDVLLWPESSTPNPVIGKHNIQEWIEDLAADMQTPLLMGNLAEEAGGTWYNGIFGVDPRSGLVDSYYRKRRLVPFGEYVPFRKYLPLINKFVPIESDFSSGTEATIVPLSINGKSWKVGGLVCYEDIFPGLARSLTREGAEFFYVATNNGWYGEEGAATQHASHSVLRAVENGRPVLRCGNDGWSGYIDERGHRRDIFVNQEGSIYTRGGKVMQVYRNLEYSSTFTIYSRYGDWFVWVCLVLAIIGAFALRKIKPPPPVSEEDEGLLPQVGLTRRRQINKK